MQDRRKTPRAIVNQVAKIQSHDGAVVQNCLVADMSDGGVRLVAESQIPDEFILFLEGDGGVGRECRVVWRLDTEIGAEFVHADGGDLAQPGIGW